MFNGEKVLAVIPARGGSKRLPRKNILPLGGKTNDRLDNRGRFRIESH